MLKAVQRPVKSSHPSGQGMSVSPKALQEEEVAPTLCCRCMAPALGRYRVPNSHLL